MLKLNKLLYSIIFPLLILSSCNTEEDNRFTSEDANNDITKISNTSPVDQSFSNEVKDFVMKKDEVTGVRGVNTETRILLAIEVAHLSQFNEQDHEKKVKKELEKKYPNKKIIVSSDQKFFFELDELEKQVQNNKIKRDELTKRVESLEKLINDEA
ncbi:YhcN/YlaJ family sporulation lipoprotein [Aquibacillus halophilus]|uniref:YhcN/YlaJ family sporulation lipoprotein n=1 Tax=Aquibacillus halophilus TaxID=930132 RepID=UPI0014785489